MLMIRLLRIGKKHDPSFRIVVTDSRNAAKSGRFIEIVGNYNPQKGEPQFKPERIKDWISKGAQVSDTVSNLLIDAKIIEGKKKDVLRHARIAKKHKKEIPKEETKTEAIKEPEPEKIDKQ